MLRRIAVLPSLILSLATVANVTAAAHLADVPSIQKTGKRVAAASAKGWGRKRALYPVEFVPVGIAAQVRGGSRDEDDEGVTEVGRQYSLLNDLRTATISSWRWHSYKFMLLYWTTRALSESLSQRKTGIHCPVLWCSNAARNQNGYIRLALNTQVLSNDVLASNGYPVPNRTVIVQIKIVLLSSSSQQGS